MGNFEKLVVMTILFLTMLVLAVTFHKGEPEDAGSPLDVVARGGSEVLAAGPAKSAPDTAAARGTALQGAQGSERVERPASGAAPEGLLSASVRDTGRSTVPATPPLVAATGGRAPIIRDWTGLERGRVDDYCYYSVGANESFESIATRIYGDPARAELLLLANEGLDAPVQGKRLFVPVFDHRAADRTPAQPMRGAALAARGTQVPATKKTATPEPASGAGGAAPAATSAVTEYVVQDGDTLSEISAAVYGTSRRYLEIFEANRDQLASPDVLAEGMLLRIPR